MRGRLLVLCLVVAGCVPPAVAVRDDVRPASSRRASAALVSDRRAALRYAAAFEAIADRTGDSRLQNRIELFRVIQRSGDLLKLERGKFPSLGARVKSDVGDRLGPDGDQYGGPLPITAEEREAAAAGLRKIAKELRASGRAKR